MASEYFSNLTGDVKTHYAEKIKLIENLDPYGLKSKDFLTNIASVPTVTIIDLVTYFTMSHSYYTSNQLKASYKSLDAFKYFEAGFVKKVECRQLNKSFLVRGEVKHSQRMNEKNVIPWIIIDSSGSILSAHCTCMAGLDEVCSHVAAVIFYLHSRPSSPNDGESCTNKLAVWSVPRASTTASPKKISQMNWGTKRGSHDTQLDNILPLDGDQLKLFLQEINEFEPEAAILRVIQPFAEQKIPPKINNLPPLLTDLYNMKFEEYSLEDLRKVSVDLSISHEQQIAVYKKTLLQSKCNSWYVFKAGRVSASVFRNVCHTSVNKPSLSLIKKICYPLAKLFWTKSVAYGFKHEDFARKEYQKMMETKHVNVQITFGGFAISVENPALGASPDGLISCECCGSGCIEIKYPYRLKDANVSMEKFVSMPGCCLQKDEEGKFILRREHAYYYQVQLQLYTTGTSYCDFVVWSKLYLYVERIYVDSDFLEEKLAKAISFHENVIVPELLGKWYTQLKHMDNLSVEFWCDCHGVDDGQEMLRCANEECEIQWFHVNCVSLADIPTEFWFCRTCSVNIFGLE